MSADLIAPEIPDRRALGMPDEPYSAYCRVCWQATYRFWVDRQPHDGSCPFGAKQITDCEQAMAWERCKGQIKRHLAAARALEAEGGGDA